MPIIVNLDVMMAKRKMSSGELAQRIGITPANLSILKNNIAHTKDLALSSARNTLSQLSNRYLELGYIPDDEFVAYKSIGESYIEAGGNTEIKTKFNLVIDTIPVKHKPTK